MKKYISSGSWFSFLYPDAWHEFEDEPGSFLFYNPISWTGNLRVSAMMDTSPQYAAEVMRHELKEYEGAVRQNIGGHEYVYSKETFQEGGAWYTSHFWVTGKRQTVVYLTYTLPKGNDVDEAMAVLESLSLLDANKPDCHEVIPIRLAEIAIVNEAFEYIQKEVKNCLKKDFSSATVESSLSYLQHLYDEGKLKNHPSTWERLGRVLGCFLIEEMDGVDWVTVIDGQSERPMLYFHVNGTSWPIPSAPLAEVKKYLVDPAKLVVDHLSTGKRVEFAELYRLLAESV